MRFCYLRVALSGWNDPRRSTARGCDGFSAFHDWVTRLSRASVRLYIILFPLNAAVICYKHCPIAFSNIARSPTIEATFDESVLLWRSIKPFPVLNRRLPFLRILSSQDLLTVCRELNLENSVEELMRELGADEHGRISYQEFLRRRLALRPEIEALRAGKRRGSPHHTHTPEYLPTSSDNSLGKRYFVIRFPHEFPGQIFSFPVTKNFRENKTKILVVRWKNANPRIADYLATNDNMYLAMISSVWGSGVACRGKIIERELFARNWWLIEQRMSDDSSRKYCICNILRSEIARV